MAIWQNNSLFPTVALPTSGAKGLLSVFADTPKVGSNIQDIIVNNHRKALNLNNMKRVLILSTLCLFLGNSCDTDDYTSNKLNKGYTPVYMDSLSFANQFKTLPSKPGFDITYLNQALSYKGHLLLQDSDSGINLIDKNTRESVGYIYTPNIQYFNTLNDSIILFTTLGKIILNTSNFPQITYVGLRYTDSIDGWANFEDIRSQVRFHSNSSIQPRYRKKFFKCPDKSKGMVVKWIRNGGEKLKCFNSF